MSQSPSTSEQKTNTSPAGGEPADFPEIKPAQNVKTGNLADTNSDEYKHRHGEHHHHHHHRHHHRHFHFLNLSPSGIRDNLKLIFKSVFTYPYMLLLLSLAFLFFMKSGAALSMLNSHKESFSTAESFYRWQEFLVLQESTLTRIPFQFTLLVALGITFVLMYQQERHWQRNVLKLLPALGAAAVFSFPMGNPKRDEEISARRTCQDTLNNYHRYCVNYYAMLNEGAFPDELPEKSSGAGFASDHYIYHGAGKKAGDEAFILLEDKDMHIGGCRFAIRSDGVFLVAKYGKNDYERLQVTPQPEEAGTKTEAKQP